MTVLLVLILGASALASNPDPSPLPPKVLFHLGQKKHLEENSQKGISDEVWEKNILGNSTRFGLVPYRRGLYGGKDFDSLELYGSAYLVPGMAGKKIPWVMKITLRDECLTAEHVTDLATDQHYLTWLFENAAYLAQNASFCLNLKTSDCGALVIGTQPVGNGREENVCDEVMKKFVIESKVKVLRDTEWASSWYLRDRACIEKLEANAQTTLETLADAKWSMASRENYSGRPAGYGTSSFLILLRALREWEGNDPTLLSRLREKLSQSDIRITSQKDQPRALWVQMAGPAVIDAFARCNAKGEGAAFRKVVENYEIETYGFLDKKIPNLYSPIENAKFFSTLETNAAQLAEQLKAACP